MNLEIRPTAAHLAAPAVALQDLEPEAVIFATMQPTSANVIFVFRHKEGGLLCDLVEAGQKLSLLWGGQQLKYSP